MYFDHANSREHFFHNKNEPSIFYFWHLMKTMGPTMIKVATVSIPNVQTTFQWLRHLHIPCGKAISA